ncbi:MAG TPA: MBL fold metallo-hydrolase, partial [Burkholderiales bacterium]|nr:MBL fold metallo-hydrolase [Burkholderiales bacterium]
MTKLLHGALGAMLALAVSVAGAQPAGRVTILYDAFGQKPGFTRDWGFAALIEYGGRRILFDTGNDPHIFADNVRAAGVDLRRLDFVVISHRHLDHTAGIAHFLSVNPDVTLYVLKEPFGVFGGALPSTFFRRDSSLAPEERYFGGQPPEELVSGTAFPEAHWGYVDKTSEIAPGVYAIALVSDTPGTR